MKKTLGSVSGKNVLLLIVAGFVNAIGVTIFIAPVNLYDSGISGLSILLSQLTPDWLSLSVFLVILNIPLFMFGYKRQGASFTLGGIIAVGSYSLFAWLISDILPIDVSIASPLAGTDLLLCALFGGVISGIGSGVALRFGGVMDGIEVLAVVFAKRLGITVGTFVMIFNIVLYIAAGCILGSWILPLYSIVTYGAALKTVDFIVEGIDRSKAAFIITEKPKEVCSALSAEFERGVTTVNAHGYYSNTEKTLVYIVINRFQIGRMRLIVHENDPTAYISITDVADVFAGKKKSV